MVCRWTSQVCGVARGAEGVLSKLWSLLKKRIYNVPPTSRLLAADERTYFARDSELYVVAVDSDKKA